MAFRMIVIDHAEPSTFPLALPCVADFSTPATAFRSGNVNAAVWENTGETGPFFSVTFSRPYKDGQGHCKTSSSYGLNDLDALSSLAELAKDWVRRQSLLRRRLRL